MLRKIVVQRSDKYLLITVEEDGEICAFTDLNVNYLREDY